METSLIVLLLICLIIGLWAYYLFQKNKQLRNEVEIHKNQLSDYRSRFADVIDADEEYSNVMQQTSDAQKEIEALRASYKEKRVIFDKLVEEAAIYDEQIELAGLGFYKPHYDFDTAEQFKEQIAGVKSEQKALISDKTAIYCTTEWEVEGSKSKGRMMTNRGIRLTARAFNNECEAAISNVTWNNVQRMEQRIVKAFEAINKLNESNKIYIEERYLELKLAELRLSFEYKEKKQQEKEEQAEIKRQMREEVKLEQESEKALKEEDKYQKLLDKAKADAQKAAGTKLAALQEKIASLGDELESAHAKSERAKSMAEQTKSGHVYVISNQGSFGENVYKIGMTRRLEPLDRVKELGDASVPFLFDVHAMIHAEDAPALENTLHNAFNFQRVNLVNNRKEFFNVSLEAIEKEVRLISPDAEFIETAEARQYRESKAIRAQREQQVNTVDIRDALPEAI
ncbi:MAG: DUF4041 domain-containing protein [Algicola sp.]|nr:DUF4041 domain-containing protein [Algicola sp.]